MKGNAGIPSIVVGMPEGIHQRKVSCTMSIELKNGTTDQKTTVIVDKKTASELSFSVPVVCESVGEVVTALKTLQSVKVKGAKRQSGNGRIEFRSSASESGNKLATIIVAAAIGERVVSEATTDDMLTEDMLKS